jgi:hypothetical protein
MLKSVGDPSVKLKSQSFSTFISEDAIEDMEVFTFLARTYQFHGSDKKEICEANALVSTLRDVCFLFL